MSENIVLIDDFSLNWFGDQMRSNADLFWYRVEIVTRNEPRGPLKISPRVTYLRHRVATPDSVAVRLFRLTRDGEDAESRVFLVDGTEADGDGWHKAHGIADASYRLFRKLMDRWVVRLPEVIRL